MSNKVNRLKNKLAIEQQLRKNQAVLLKKLSEKKQLLDDIFKGGVTELVIVHSPNNGKGPITMTIRGLIETIDPENNKVIFRTISDVA